jgi:glycosyltransferase involved in cell wall biosynthesis
MTSDNNSTTSLKTGNGEPVLQGPNRPRLLFLAYSFPPLHSPGTMRAGYLAKYLARLGWDVAVVTPDPVLWSRTDRPGMVEQMLKEEGIRRITTGLRWRCLDASYVRFWNRGLGWLLGGMCRVLARWLSIEPQTGWPREIEKACRSLRKGDVDIILATGNPFVSFQMARQLGTRLRAPFVLDYRDPWTNDPHNARSKPPRIVREERSLLRDCSAVTIISPSLAISLRQTFPNVKEIHAVTNGYDPEDLSRVVPRKYDHFAIVYAGGFYLPNRVITPVMKALQNLASSQVAGLPEWRFHYFGAAVDHVSTEAETFGICDHVVLHGQRSREEALSAVAGADITVVITSVQEKGCIEERGIITGKVFESLGARVLLIAPVGSDAEAIVEETNCGRRFAGNQTVEIAKYLREVMAGQHKKPVPPVKYSWSEIALQFDALLRRIVDEHRRDLPQE